MRDDYAWLAFALMTVAAWGTYGVLLHKGATGMAGDPNARYKAYLFVGIAYFITAVIAPLVILLAKGATWDFSRGLMGWSLVAGTAGAIGAFCVLLAFGAKGSPAVVMSIVFAGAPIVNALIVITLAQTWANLRWQFILGVVLAAVGGSLVTLYKPPPKQHGHPPAAQPVAAQASVEPNPS